MPRGENPKSRENLKKAYGGKGGFTTETARKASKKAAPSKAILKDIKEIARENTTNEKLLELLELLEKRARHSDTSFELLLKLLGMLPKTQIEVSAPLDDSIREMSEYFGQSKDSGTAKK